MDRRELQDRLCGYRSRFPEEAAYAYRACRLLEESPRCFDRNAEGLHVTASTWVLNARRDATLLMLHRKLNQWFQPGGHADSDEDVLQVAFRECSEETGLPVGHIRLLSPMVFDVDIHRIPATRTEPEHEHLDIRFLVEIDESLPLPGNNESHDLRWVALRDVPRYNRGRSLHRLVVKSGAWRRLA
ncbi:NUDIX hydrolase [Acidiferrobacter sp.]|jgi:8-oxo-dGTP pyrophosphatase MutT (NUDIX family)|uniref:NUDIX hydrolase n=1 Tax=Acidiferrobacter sp. TaxID=1872107 RepID=UPI00261C0BA0|nr:NUDIX hydrolase [Acidiferrobacter sp.]